MSMECGAPCVVSGGITEVLVLRADNSDTMDVSVYLLKLHSV